MLILQLDMDQQGGDYTLHITHTATGYYTATVCREATHYPQLSRQCTMLATALQPLYAVWLGWAGLGTAASY